jgi:hypothetical protein
VQGAVGRVGDEPAGDKNVQKKHLLVLCMAYAREHARSPAKSSPLMMPAPVILYRAIIDHLLP